LDGAPSTHILKPDSDRLVGSVKNEAFCLSLARRCRLAVPDVTTGIAGARAYLLIARYDRAQVAGRWRRWHQEDFCQILGRPPSAKYERNRAGIAGPTLPEMIAAVRRYGLAPDVLTIFDAALFSILACNTDAHAKNYSMIVHGPGRAQMAPLYDVMCAEPYDQITRNLAQTIAGKNRGEHLRRRHWLRFAAEAGLGPSLLLRRIDSLAARALDNIDGALADTAAMPAGDHPILAAVADAVARRCRAVREGLTDMQGDDGD
jgi:serine/threonine-protein kinase HipA